MLAGQEKANVRQLCRQFEISPTTAYKWLERFQANGVQGLQELSRRPQRSPARTAEELEKAVIAQRQKHPAWGGRKLRARLLALGHTQVPSPSTITSILHRHQMVTKEESRKHTAWLRFEHPQPNDLWQMDFKGHFALGQGRCYPLTVLDDHSRFALGLVACASQNTQTTRAALTEVFRRYGLPWRLAMDNGSPWAAHGGVSLSKIQSDILEQHSLDPSLAVSCPELLAFVCFSLHKRLIRHYLATPRRIVYAPLRWPTC
jgi:transposase InsO family protein